MADKIYPNFLNISNSRNNFISTSNSEQKEQTNREKYVFYCSVSQIHINPEKNTPKPSK